MTTAPKTKPAKKKAKAANKFTSKGRFALIRARLAIQKQLDAAKLKGRLVINGEAVLTLRMGAPSVEEAERMLLSAVPTAKIRGKVIWVEESKLAVLRFSAKAQPTADDKQNP